MKKKDFILIACILVIAALCYLWTSKDEAGDNVVITLDGKEYGVYDLGVDREITVESEYGYNKVIIKDNKVSITEADCPDKYCVKQGETDNGNKSLVCLPHKLVVEIRGYRDYSNKRDNGTEDVDAISQ